MPVLSQVPYIVDAPAAHALFGRLGRERVEIAAFAYLARDGRLLGMRHMQGARVDAVDVPIRRVVADALAFDAAAVLMAHNHPSGDPRPSAADRETTRRLLLALAPVGVRLIDHLVLAPGDTASFRALGWL
ncbi:JAB domain-containing protein [Sphingomonas pituitosa]|uniref:JAB domain-containing protein n=1 Tax=Sphingomonas pituitosa TaxID=99597 RepID=UPI00083504A3|nr:JAB domain-containing protein [Sphingomonas pituitosa]